MAAAAHVLVFPFPAQGHINCMMHFATGLLGAGLHVTFLHSDRSLRRLGGAAAALAAASPRLRFLSIPDGLPDDHARAAGDLLEHLESIRIKGSVAYRVLLVSLVLRAGDGGSAGFPPVTCVVADGIMPFAIDVAEEIGVPALGFRTVSACSFLAYLSIPRLFELGELPFPAGGDLDEPVRGVPGMETFLRRRDLPSFCRGQNDPMLQTLIEVTAHSRTARALVLNTSASMEGPALAHIAPRMRDVFAIGPLHTMFPAPAAAGSLWRADDGCMAWLDGQPDRSVVYVSLGSFTVISLEQFTEFLHGLVAAGHAFLWVLRPDMVGASQSAALREAVAAAGDSKARVVEWAPQLDVLRHRAVGCFLTHAGWNSTLEAAVEGVPTVCWPFFADQQINSRFAAVEGVPTVCWPFFADQQINSRFVAAVWRTGLDMKDVCDAAVVERMVREAMESAEIRASAQALARQLRRDIADDGGSSAAEFQRLVGFIKELSQSMADSKPDDLLTAGIRNALN
uniref:Glycosyltransferase n=1 Tax=Oryza meridionalis TaxID=40149 RepID=A0A0E0EBC0_9ORYZ